MKLIETEFYYTSEFVRYISFHEIIALEIYICIRNQQKTQGAAARNSKFLRDKGIDSPIKISSNEEILGWGHGLFFSINLITRNSFFPGRERA